MGKFNYLFSRNCVFGIKTNSDGSYSIFTRGVDRVTLRIEELIGMALYDGNAFQKADELWNAFQNKLAKFIDDNSFPGNAFVIHREPERVDFELVHDYLFGG